MYILFQSILHSYDIPDDLIKIRDISADPNQSEIQVSMPYTEERDLGILGS